MGIILGFKETIKREKVVIPHENSLKMRILYNRLTSKDIALLLYIYDAFISFVTQNLFRGSWSSF